MRPVSPYRRHSAIALVFAAWCAAYGLPAELARNLTAQTVGLSQSSARPAQQAKVLLGRLSHQVRRAEAVRLPFVHPQLEPVAPGALAGQASNPIAPTAPPPDPLSHALFQRPPPASFSA